MSDRYLVSLNCIKPMCDLLTVMDSKIVQVSLNGLENILRLGEQESKQNGTGINPYCALIEEAYGTCAHTHTRMQVVAIVLSNFRMFVLQVWIRSSSCRATRIRRSIRKHLI